MMRSQCLALQRDPRTRGPTVTERQRKIRPDLVRSGVLRNPCRSKSPFPAHMIRPHAAARRRRSLLQRSERQRCTPERQHKEAAHLGAGNLDREVLRGARIHERRSVVTTVCIEK